MRGRCPALPPDGPLPDACLLWAFLPHFTQRPPITFGYFARVRGWQNLPTPNQRVHHLFCRAKFTDASKAGQRAVSPACPEERRSWSFSLPDPGEQSWDACLPRVVAMTTSSITSLSASTSLKHQGREGIRTAERGEKNNCLTLPSPPTWEEGNSLPFHLINGKLCSPERGRSLGGRGGRKWLDSASCPGCREQQTQQTWAPTCFKSGLKKAQKGPVPGKRHRNSAGTGPVGERTTATPSAELPLCRCSTCFRYVILSH